MACLLQQQMEDFEICSLLEAPHVHSSSLRPQDSSLQLGDRMTPQYTYSRSPDQPYAVEMIPLSKEELDSLRMDAKATYDSLFPAVQAAVRFGGDGEVFNVGHNSNNKSMVMWTTSVLFGTLEEVAALYLDQDEQMPIMLDSARSRRLYELEKPSSERPLHGAAMRWSLWKPPTKLSDGRDVCFLEYMDSFVDRATESRVWARSMQSINHLSCPASQHPQGPVRMHMRVSGMLFRETDRPNHLEHVMFIHIDGKGTPNWIMHQVFAANKKAADSLNQVLKVMRQLKPGRAPSYSKSIGSYPSEEDTKRDCKACKDHVSKWTIAKHCRFCDAILCKKCAEICYHRTDVNGKNDRMCLSCALSSTATSHSLNERDYSRHNRVQTRHRNATVASGRERQSSDSKHHALSKQTSLPPYLMQSNVGLETKNPTVSIPEPDNPVDFRERFENMQIYNPSTANSQPQLNAAECTQRSRHARGSRALTLDLEPRRAEPIDLSYLSELVTPRAGASKNISSRPASKTKGANNN